MMDKNSLILKNFQKSQELTVKNKKYQNHITEFFNWLLKSDEISHDTTTHVTLGKQADKVVQSRIITKSDTVIAGLEELEYLLKVTSFNLLLKTSDGKAHKKGEVILELSGSVSDILSYERAILNILQRMSGIASETEKYVKAVKSSGSKIPYILATRKTPLMMFDKKAVAVGGGLTHRLTLEDGILVKDNHLLFIKEKYQLKTEAKIIQKVIEIIFSQNIAFAEIEIEEDESVFQALKSFEMYKQKSSLGILLDNFSPERAKTVIEEVGKKFGTNNVIFEASGGVKFENIEDWAKSGVDIISVGALTHSVKAADLSLEFM